MALVVAGGLAAYLAGSLPSGVLFARSRGIDLRTVGSGNIGATNAARTLGRRTGLYVLLLDVAKGALVVGMARAMGAPPVALAVFGGAAVVGHVFPVWLRFRGGKGVATGLGALFVVAPFGGLAMATTYLLVVRRTRLSSVGSLGGIFAAWLTTLVIERPGVPLAFVSALFVLILFTHRENLRRLRRGTENGL